MSYTKKIQDAAKNAKDKAFKAGILITPENLKKMNKDADDIVAIYKNMKKNTGNNTDSDEK